MMHNFPEAPEKRRTIVFLNEHEMQKCDYDPEMGQLLLDEELFVISFPFTGNQANLPMALQNIKDADLIRSDSVLIQSPFDCDVYEEMRAAPNRYALDKHLYFSTFCQLLGAKEISVKQIQIDTNGKSSKISVDGKRSGAKLNATIENKQAASFQAHLSLIERYAGGLPDIEAASKYLRAKKLSNDPVMRSLLEKRSFSNNSLEEQELVINLSQEVNKNMNIKAQAKFKSFASLKGEYNTESIQKNEYTLTVLVKF